MSFCTVGAPLSPIAPIISSSTTMGNPPPHAAIRGSVGMPAKSDGSALKGLNKSRVGRPNKAVYALFCAISMQRIGAPSIENHYILANANCSGFRHRLIDHFLCKLRRDAVFLDHVSH